jgi:hypothetical protein
MSKKLAVLSEALDNILEKSQEVKKTVDSIKVADEDQDKEAAFQNSVGHRLVNLIYSLSHLPDLIRDYLSGKKVKSGNIEEHIKRLEVSLKALERAKPSLVAEIGEEVFKEFFEGPHSLKSILQKPIDHFNLGDEDEAREHIGGLTRSIFSWLKSFQHVYQSLDEMKTMPKLKTALNLLVKEFNLLSAFDTRGRPLQDFTPGAKEVSDLVHPEQSYERRVEA